VTVISSSLTRFHKQLVPVIWLVVLAIVIGGAIASGETAAIATTCVAAIVMSAIGLMLMKRLVWDMADEVEDHGDYLLVRKGDEEERIALASIMKVTETKLVNPPRVTLRLVNCGRFGTDIVFTPAMTFRLNPLAKHPVVSDLNARADLARARRVASSTGGAALTDLLQ